jgi:hypothetical protein
MKKKYIGKWWIKEMELWDKEYIDLVAQGHFMIKSNGTGSFQFGAVEAGVDCKVELVKELSDSNSHLRVQMRGTPFLVEDGPRSKAQI